MALVRVFKEKSCADRWSAHDEIEASYFVGERDGRLLLQIDTHGRATRQHPDKVSQSIQLDRVGAEKLHAVLKKTFGFV